MTNGFAPAGFKAEGVLGYVYSSADVGAVCLQRYYSAIVAGVFNHISTTDEGTRGEHALGFTKAKRADSRGT